MSTDNAQQEFEVKPVNPRMKLACDLVRNGMPKRKALLKAGYSPHSTKALCRKGATTLKKNIYNAEKQYLNEYFEECKKNGFDGVFTASKLKEMADKSGNPKTDFNAILAIKEHNRIIMRGIQNAPEVKINGIFILPNRDIPENWLKEVKTIQSDVVDDNQRYVEPVNNSVNKSKESVKVE